MLLFDISCVSLAFILFFLVKPGSGAKLIALQFVLQFVIDVIFIDLGLYEYVASRWFYLTKGLVLGVTIVCIAKYYNPSFIIFLLFSTMIFQFGLWWEEITFIYNVGVFNKYFLPYMLANSTIQILFLIGSTHVAGFAGIYSSGIFHWFRLHNRLDSDMYIPHTKNGSSN